MTVEQIMLCLAMHPTIDKGCMYGKPGLTILTLNCTIEKSKLEFLNYSYAELLLI